MTIAASAVVFDGTELGAGVVIEDQAVVGKQATLGRSSTATRDPLPPLVVGDGCAILAAAVVFAGSRLGNGVIVGDQACVRERVTVGEGSVIGRGTLVENDVAIGARCRIQANAYVTALHDDRGRRLHRALCRDDERQLHGSDGAPPRPPARSDHSPPGADRWWRRTPSRGRDRRGGLRRCGRGRHEGRPAPRGRRRKPCPRHPPGGRGRVARRIGPGRMRSGPYGAAAD